MNRVDVGVLVLEVAAGVLAQATGVGGPVAVAAAAGVLVVTIAYLFVRGRRARLSVRIDRFLGERRASEPLDADASTRADYETDTLDCYRRVFGHEVRLETVRLRNVGAIGRKEALRFNHPTTVGDIELIVERLSEYEGR